MREEIGYWMGKPISQMDRDELLAVIKALGRAHEQQLSAHQNELDMLRLLSEARPRKRIFGLF